MSGIVISLCDLTGNFVRPWVDAGYDAVLVDPQHGISRSDGTITKLAMTVEEALPHLAHVIATGRVAFVAGWPPCTHLSGSGARYHQRKMTDKTWKHYQGPNMYFDACRIVWQWEMVGQLSGAPWLVENPVGRLSTFWRTPDHKFHPYEFTALEPDDNYTKKTCLWTGGGFVMPAQQRDLTLGPPDDRIHKASPSAERGNFRSATPMGFARAVFQANAPVAAEVAA